MGSVKIDIHKKEREFSSLTLSDINVVKLLIEYREKLDPCFQLEQDFNMYHAGIGNDLNTELISLYSDLDKAITDCNFDSGQIAIIKLLGEGFTLEEIGNEISIKKQNVDKRFDTLCQKIVDSNNEKWMIYIHKNYNKTKFRACSKCSSLFPLTKSFFGIRKENFTGLRSECRTCEIKRKKRAKENTK